MHSRNNDISHVQNYFAFRKHLYIALHDFDLDKSATAIAEKENITDPLSELITQSRSKDKLFFSSLRYITIAVFQLIEYFQKMLAADPSAPAHNTAAAANAGLAADGFRQLDASRPSVNQLSALTAKINICTSPGELLTLIQAFQSIALPVIFEVDAPISYRFTNDTDARINEPLEKPVISVILYFDKELWANPQVIQPQHQYHITGHLKYNYWPEGYDYLQLLPVTTSSDSWYSLSLPELKQKNDEKSSSINGLITLNNPQGLLDPPVVIKLFAIYKAAGKPDLYPALIGYDQLTVKVINDRSFPFPTGYNALNKKAFEIVNQLMQELPSIDRQELEDFIIMLSAILNYQGYCYQYNIYRDENTLDEAIFRDRLIAFLSAKPEITPNLIKERPIAGGRVEISFRSIVAELKVETKQSDREKIMQDHQKQPTAYAAGTGAFLSILCILDLTAKINPPAPASANVFLRHPSLHGFEGAASAARVAIIFIDGNTPKPSRYAGS